MAWFKKARRPIASTAVPNHIPEGLWVKCQSCGKILYEKDLVKDLRVCSKCGHHLQLTATQRLDSLLDEASWT